MSQNHKAIGQFALACLALFLMSGCNPNATPPSQTEDVTLSDTSPIAIAEQSDQSMSALMSALMHPQRPESHRDRDVHRHPLETLAFFGVTPEMTVIELSPGGGWYSEILARYLKDKGQLIAAHWDMNADLSEGYRRARGQYDERFGDVDQFGNVQIIPFSPPQSTNLGDENSADVVLSFRNVHSWQRSASLPTVFAAAFDVLKPGGVFGVVGHRLPEDREQDPEARSGYVKESHVIAVAEAAGFVLDGRSEINANPLDTADHPNGVWNLAPSLRIADGDEKDYAAIGESDRFTLRFKKAM